MLEYINLASYVTTLTARVNAIIDIVNDVTYNTFTMGGTLVIDNANEANVGLHVANGAIQGDGGLLSNVPAPAQLASAYAHANAAYNTANVAGGLIVALDSDLTNTDAKATGAFTQANTALTTGNAAYAHANGAFDKANTNGNLVANVSLHANAAYNAANVANAALANLGSEFGKHTIVIPASGVDSVDSVFGDWTGSSVIKYDYALRQNTVFHVSFPEGWDNGNVTFRTFCRQTSNVANSFVWYMRGMAVPDQATMNVDFSGSNPGTLTDTANNLGGEILLVSPESSNVVIGGSGNMVFFELYRNVDDAGDTLAANVELIDIHMYYAANVVDD